MRVLVVVSLWSMWGRADELARDANVADRMVEGRCIVWLMLVAKGDGAAILQWRLPRKIIKATPREVTRRVDQQNRTNQCTGGVRGFAVC